MFSSIPKIRIPGIGPREECQIAFIGEAPGMTEEKLGQPFVGVSGSLLTTLMQQAGISRTEVYLTNVIKERPPKNDITTFVDIKPKGVAVTSEFTAYVEQLKEELSSCSANVLVAVGNVPLYALTGKIGVTRYRGSILSSTLLPGRKVIPIIHPSSALRQYIFRHYILHDLKRIKEDAAFPELRLPQRTLKIEPSFDDCISFLLGIITEASSTACDIEVTNEEVSCISFAPSSYLAISIPFVGERGDYFTVEQETAVWLLIERILSDPSIKKIFQNAIFDTTYLFSKMGIITKNYDDTMIAHAVLYPDLPKGLDFLTATYTREPYYKDDGKKYFKYGGRFQDFWAYNAKDSAVLQEIMPKLMQDLEISGNLETYQKQVELIEPLTYMTIKGIKVNLAAREEVAKKNEAEIQKLTSQLHDLAGFSLNFASPKQLCDYFYTLKKVKPYLDRKTHRPTVDVNALKRLARKGFKEAELIQTIRGLAKMNSTYLEMNLDSDNRLRGSFNPVGTTSLRLSCSKSINDTGGNTQNLPYGVRQFLEADDGYVCYQLDLSQAENRVVAYISPEPAMIECFETKKDVHTQTAALIFGKPMSLISDDDGSCAIGGGKHSERYWGKKANHGLNYDLGYKMFAFYYEIPEAEAKFICQRYHAAYPGISRYHQWVKDKLAKSRMITNIFGWNRIFLDQWGDDLFKVAYSFIPQSSVAAALNRRGIIEPYYKGLKVEFLNNVHDAVWIQKKISDGWLEHARALLALKKSLEQPLTWGNYTFSIPADVEIGLNFGKRGKTNPKGLTKVKFTTGTSVEELAYKLKNIYHLMLNPQVHDVPAGLRWL